MFLSIVYNVLFHKLQLKLENTEVTIKNGQFRETGNIRHTRRRKKQQQNNTICARHHYIQTNTNNVSKICNLVHTSGGKDLCGNRFGNHNTELRK